MARKFFGHEVSTVLNSSEKCVKRLFDIVVSACGLLLLWPLIVVCVIVARFDTGESGIFSQIRVGRHGELFNVYKIRSMFRFENTKQTTVTVQGDMRISRSGRILRRLKLDELPQLWNVLIGEMSFVGPRPDVPGYADNLTGSDKKLLELQPGITGPATLKYRNEEALLASQSDPEWYNDNIVFPDKVAINLEYMETYSLRKDIAYILMTAHVLKIPDQLAADGLHSGDSA